MNSYFHFLKYIIKFSIFNFFLIRLNQICPKWIKLDQTWSHLISDEIIIEIYHQIFNFIYFWSDWIRSVKIDQNGSNWIKMDQNWSKWIQTDQNWSNWISDEISIEIYHQIFNFIYFLIKMDQTWSKRIKLDQNGSKLIKLDFWWNNQWNISSDFQIYLFFDQNGSDLSKMDQTGSNLISDEMIIEIYHQILNFIYFLIKMDQTWSNSISDEIIVDFQFYLSFDQIESDLSKIVNIIKFAILSLSLFLVFNHFDNIG